MELDDAYGAACFIGVHSTYIYWLQLGRFIRHCVYDPCQTLNRYEFYSDLSVYTSFVDTGLG